MNSMGDPRRPVGWCLLLVLGVAGAAAPAAAGEMSTRPVSATDAGPLGARNLSVRPGDDFNAYANGAWIEQAEIPAASSSTSVWTDAEGRVEAAVRALIKDAATNPVDASAAKLGMLYSAFMNEDLVEAHDAKPLLKQLAAIQSIATREQLAEFFGRTHGAFGSSLFSARMWADVKIPTLNALRLSTGGMGLSDPKLYLDDRFAKTRESYRAYVAASLKLVDWPDPEQSADEVVAFETRLATANAPESGGQDREKLYNPMSIGELETFAPGFPWRSYFRGASLERLNRVVVGQKAAFPKYSSLFSDTPIAVLKAWEAFHVIDESSPYLSKRFSDNRFSFRQKALQGIQQQRPREERAIAFVDRAMGEEVGKEYVRRYFSPASKRAADNLAENLKRAMRGRISKLEWMSASTKSAALAKLEKLRILIGYPAKWRNYAELKVTADDLYGDAERAKAFAWKFQVTKYGRPVDRDEWYLRPQDVDAFSDFSQVAIEIPAGILQPPFFDPKADPAVYYGEIGSEIGHEITHQFDPEGRKVDLNGALHNWWSGDDEAEFKKATGQLAAQFDKYEVDGIRLNGGQTLSEDVADLGGVLIALDAYHATLGGRPAPVIGGLTGDQRFFLGRAQAWRAKQRKEYEKAEAIGGDHSLPRFRIWSTARNVDEWYLAFDVRVGDRLYLTPQQRARIW